MMYGRGLFLGISLIPMQAATFLTIRREDSGKSSAVSSTNRQVSSSVGVAVLATVLTERLLHHTDRLGPVISDPAQAAAAGLAGYHEAFFVAVVLAAIGFFAAFLIRDEDAAASMGKAKPDPSHAPVSVPAEAVASH